MTSWSLLLCEGAHDQEFLCCLATQSGIWEHAKKCPENVLASLPRATNYLCLTQGDKTLVVANLNGIENILGDHGTQIVEFSLKAGTVGVILDADDRGVEARRDEVRKHFGPILPSAKTAEPRQVVSDDHQVQDQRRFGLWVAPDCVNQGSLDDVIRKAADAIHPTLTPIADKFVTDLGTAADHAWEQFREKAVLGSLGQPWKAGGSLASALQERDQWMSAKLAAQEPFCDLLAFMAQLVA